MNKKHIVDFEHSKILAENDWNIKTELVYIAASKTLEKGSIMNPKSALIQYDESTITYPAPNIAELLEQVPLDNIIHNPDWHNKLQNRANVLAEIWCCQIATKKRTDQQIKNIKRVIYNCKLNNLKSEKTRFFLYIIISRNKLDSFTTLIGRNLKDAIERELILNTQNDYNTFGYEPIELLRDKNSQYIVFHESEVVISKIGTNFIVNHIYKSLKENEKDFQNIILDITDPTNIIDVLNN